MTRHVTPHAATRVLEALEGCFTWSRAIERRWVDGFTQPAATASCRDSSPTSRAVPEPCPSHAEAVRRTGPLIRVVSAAPPSYRRLHESVLIHRPGVRGLDPTLVMKQAVHPRPLPGRSPRETTAAGPPA